MKKYTLIIISLLAISGTLRAQLETDRLEFFSPFKAKLIESKKIDAHPTLPDVKESDKLSNLTYPEGQPIPVKVDYDAPTIKPLAMPTPPKKEMYGFYTKLGFGTPMSPLAEVSYHNKKSEKIDFGITYKHHSAKQINPINFQQFSNHHALIDGAYHLNDALAVGGHVGYDWNGLHFYGYTPGDVVTKDSIFQRFSRVNGGVKLFNSKANDKGLNYSANVNFYTLADKFKSKELGLDAVLACDKAIGENHLFKIDGGVYFANFKDSTAQKNFVPYVRPAYLYHAGAFRAKLGVYMGGDNNKFFISPDVELSYNILKEKLAAYAGFTGEIRQNTFDRLTRYNPYLTSHPKLTNTRLYEGYAGVRGEAGEFSYDAKAAYRIANVLPFFLNDATENYRRFIVLYDTTNIFTLSGSLQVPFTKELKLDVGAAYHFYSGISYGLPNLDLNSVLSYTWKDKFIAKAQLFALSGVNYVNESTYEPEVLPVMLDLNLGLLYFVHKNIGLFVDANNLLNNKAARWNRYPQYGINFMGGVIVKF